MIILAFLVAAEIAPHISSEPIAQDRYRLRMSGRVAGIGPAQAALAPAARKLCDSRPVVFETFRISNGAVDQEIFCGRPKVSPEGAAPPRGWQPSAGDQHAILAATYGYFAAKDRGHYESAWSMLSPTMKQMSPAAEWRQQAKDFNARAGAVRSRRVTEITWYNNPADAPQPGVYVAADYSADFAKLDFVCGYLMWRVQPDGSLTLTREEQNIFDRTRAKVLASIDRSPLRAQMGCKD